MDYSKQSDNIDLQGENKMINCMWRLMGGKIFICILPTGITIFSADLSKTEHKNTDKNEQTLNKYYHVFEKLLK